MFGSGDFLGTDKANGDPGCRLGLALVFHSTREDQGPVSSHCLCLFRGEPDVNNPSSNGQAFSKLSRQEKSVFLLLSEGKSDAEIAKLIFLGEGSIRNYVHGILSKLALSDRAAARDYAIQHDLKSHMQDDH